MKRGMLLLLLTFVLAAIHGQIIQPPPTRHHGFPGIATKKSTVGDNPFSVDFSEDFGR